MGNKSILGGKIANAINIHQEALHLTLQPVMLPILFLMQCHKRLSSIENTSTLLASMRTGVLNDGELLVALHQKQDRHHDWLKRQMKSLWVDVNRTRNLATKNAFVAP